VTISEDGVSWTSDDFFVPPSLWGGGLGHSFLRALIAELTRYGIAQCTVVVNGPDEGMVDQALWEERRRFLSASRISAPVGQPLRPG
jgi:hypothetical protein